MTDKNDTIAKIYNDKSGFGSIKNTLDDARKIDKSININDVKLFFNNNVEKKDNLKGMNSFIAPHANYEYQMDLFFIPNDEILEKQDFRVGMLMIDIFSKYMAVVPIKSKKEGDVASGLIECLHKMGGKPQILYTDGETALNTDAIQTYLKEHNIKHLVTRTSAWFAERGVRTFKSMLYKRIENSKNKNIQWNDFIYEILLTYNNKLINSSTKYTPSEARKPSNEFNVRINLLVHKKHTRLYPQLEVGSKVRIYNKKMLGAKQQKSTWSDSTYEVEKIIHSLGQPFFKLKAFDRHYMRSELLKN